MKGNALIKGGARDKDSAEIFKGTKFDPETFIDIKKVQNIQEIKIYNLKY